MDKRQKGIAAAAFSSIIFGIVPIMAKLAFDGGSNGITMAFTRYLLSIPILYAILKIKKIPLVMSKKEFRDMIFLSLFGTSLTSVSLYSSLLYISAGMSTVLHYIYPVLVALGGVFIYHKKITSRTLISLLLGFGGILFFYDRNGNMNLIGMLLALASGFSYAYMILGMENSNVRNFHYFKTSFYLCLFGAVITGIFGTATKQLNLDLTGEAWFYSFLASILASIGALSLLKLAVAYCGSSSAAILSTLEPITSIAFGYLLLHETMSMIKYIGCALILCSIVLVALPEKPDTQRRI